MLSAFSVVWKSPPPDMGAAVVTANIRRHNERKWTKLSYSLKESSVRIYSKAQELASMKSAKIAAKMKSLEDQKAAEQLYSIDAVGKYDSFDQLKHHELFWEYIRDKQWASLESFLDQKSVVYYESDRRVRPWRIVDLFRTLFGSTSGLVLACPFIYKPGLTRSRVVSEIDIARGFVRAVTRNQKPGVRESGLALSRIRNDAKDDDLESVEDERDTESLNSLDDKSDSSEDSSSKSNKSKEINDQKDDKKEGIPMLILNDAIAGVEESRTLPKQHENETETLSKTKEKELEILQFTDSIRERAILRDEKGLDESDKYSTQRSRSKPLQLPQIVFTAAVEGPDFIKTVKALANDEHNSITNMRQNKVLESEEKREFLMSPLKAR